MDSEELAARSPGLSPAASAASPLLWSSHEGGGTFESRSRVVGLLTHDNDDCSEGGECDDGGNGGVASGGARLGLLGAARSRGLDGYKRHWKVMLMLCISSRKRRPKVSSYCSI